MNNRNKIGKNKEEAVFQATSDLSEMGDNYLHFIEEIKNEIRRQRVSVVLNANSSMICLYWNIGKAILEKQEKEGWGAKVIERMAKDLKEAFPDMAGFSEILNICVNLRSAGRILKLCNRSLHNYLGEQILNY